MNTYQKFDAGKSLCIEWLKSNGYQVQEIGNRVKTGYHIHAVKDTDSLKIYIRAVIRRPTGDMYFKHEHFKKHKILSIKTLWYDLSTNTVGWNRDYF